MTKTEPDTWEFTCPDGNEYHVGDIIPMHRAAEGIIFGEEVVRIACPGFPGATVINEITGEKIEIPAIPPSKDCFFVGPESQGWRWQYARSAIMHHKAHEAFEQKQLLKALGNLDEESGDAGCEK